MILYAVPLSSYSAKVRIALVAKGVAFEEREPPGGYRSAAYRELVPMGMVPAIDDAGFVLSESEAINEYLEERFPEPALLPREPSARARVRFLSRFHDLYLEPPVRGLFAHVEPARRDPGAVAARVGEFRRRLDQLAGMARPAPLLAGERLSLADCGYAVTVPLAGMLFEALGDRLTLPEPIARWQATLAGHAAVRRALDGWRPATERWIAARLAATP
jgi:glutathione S-transferase